MFGDKDQKTEKPTAKRKREARKKGQVSRSPDVSAWLTMLAASALIPMLVRSAGSRLTGLTTQSANVMSHPTEQGALKILGAGLGDMVAIVMPTLGVIAAIGIVANVAQVGFVFATKAAAPQFTRLNPLNGIKRLFSVSTVQDLLKQVVKLTLLVVLAYRAISGIAHAVGPSQPVGMGPIVDYASSSLLGLMRAVAIGGLVLSVGDYALKRRRTMRMMRMTKQEVKDEYRNQEGDPVVKGAIRRKQRSLSRMRMMAAVAGADVVVTNPTHYAVALRYEAGRGAAPRVVAKGSDEMALRIREVAKEKGVPVVEDPPLARAIYGACEIDAFIPRELYVAVARLLAFVFTLPTVVRRSGVVHRRPVTALVA